MGLGNLLENAVDFAETEGEIDAQMDAGESIAAHVAMTDRVSTRRSSTGWVIPS